MMTENSALQQNTSSWGIFPLVECLTCQSKQIAYAQLKDDFLVYTCFFCDTSTSEVEFADEFELKQRGLHIVSMPSIEPQLPQKKSGCSKNCSKNRKHMPQDSLATSSSCGTNSGCGSCASGCGSRNSI